jgi:hypothetical protein
MAAVYRFSNVAINKSYYANEGIKKYNNGTDDNFLYNNLKIN